MTSTADGDEGRTFAAALFGRSDNADDDAPNDDDDGPDGARQYAIRLFSHATNEGAHDK